MASEVIVESKSCPTDSTGRACPIFMIGMPRSGTSIISEAVSLHESLGWISPLMMRFPSLYWLAALNLLSELPTVGNWLRGRKKQSKGLTSRIKRYLPYSAEAFPVWQHCFGEKFLWEYLSGKQATLREKEVAKKLVDNILKFQNKKQLFAKFTGPPRINFLHSVFPDAFFVHIIRDPRAVTASLLNVSFWKDGGGLHTPWWKNLPESYMQNWRASGSTPAGLAAIQWRYVIELAQAEKKQIPTQQYLEIRYEDFVENPHHRLTEVFSKAGILDSERAHKYINSQGAIRDNNNKYKKTLSNRDVDIIMKITAEAATKYGYFLS